MDHQIIHLALALGMWTLETYMNASFIVVYMCNQPILAGQSLLQSLSVALSFEVEEGTAARCVMALRCFVCLQGDLCDLPKSLC